MKNLFIIVIILSLSCKDKIVSNETKIVEIAANVTESPAKIEAASAITETIKSPYIRSTLYKGTLNNSIKISLYMIEQESPCGGDSTFFTAMYKYNNQDKWILLGVTTNLEKKNFSMVEDGFTGALFLEKTEADFIGFWISPDTKKQFKIVLKNQLLDTKFAKDDTLVNKLDDILFDDLLYNKNDC